MRKLFPLLLYPSLLFLGWYLYRSDYLAFGEVRLEPVKLSLSLLLLFAGFVVSGLSWGYALRLTQNRVSPAAAIRSQGLSVLAKYIPGRFWVLLGRAVYVSSGKTRLKLMSVVSLQEQLVYLWWGLALSVLPVFRVSDRAWPGIIILSILASGAFILLNGKAHGLFTKLTEKVFKGGGKLPVLTPSFFLRVSGPVILYWLLWTAGFYLLMLSASGSVPPLLSLAFPLSVTAGIIVIIAPGGLGVREGLITGFLAAGGMTPEYSLTIAVITRFWFIAGELFIFMLAWVLKISDKGGDYPVYPSTSQT